MNLHETLTQFAEDFGLDAARLIQYADEDTLTGWDYGKGGWEIGSIFQVEGQFLYALTRYFQPAQALELGTWHGCSATHILTAMDVNEKGQLTSVDVKMDAGYGIPPQFRKRWTLENRMIGDFIPLTTRQYDLVFEDGDHSTAQLRFVWERADIFLRPGGWLVSHDADHFLVGEAVREGIRQSGLAPKIYHPQPADCGLAIWRKPSLTLQEVDAVLYDEVENVEWLNGNDPAPLEVLSYDELKALAKERGISVRGRINRETLIERLRDIDG